MSERVTLRPLTIADLDSFLLWAMDPEVTHHLRWETYTSRAAAEEFFKNVVHKHPWFQAIVLNNEVIGSITLEQGEGVFSCKTELGYVSAKKYWGQGHMTHALQLAVEAAFQNKAITRIEAFVRPENKASCRVLEKNKFSREALLKKAILRKGTIEDLYLYALTR